MPALQRRAQAGKDARVPATPSGGQGCPRSSDADPRWWLPCEWHLVEVNELVKIEPHFHFKQIAPTIFEIRPKIRAPRTSLSCRICSLKIDRKKLRSVSILVTNYEPTILVFGLCRVLATRQSTVRDSKLRPRETPIDDPNRQEYGLSH